MLIALNTSICAPVVVADSGPPVQAPTATAPPLIAPTAPMVGQTVTITEGQYSGSGPITITGVLTLDGVDVTAQMSGTSYTIPGDTPDQAALVWTETARNAGGTAQAQSVTETVQGASSGLATITTQSSISHNGVTFTFDRPVDTCRSCLGEPAVIANQTFNITAISPASASANGFVAHGTMVDPGDLATTGQGFDEMLSDNSAPGQSVSATAYVPGLNVDGAIAVSPGDSLSVVKSVRLAGKTSPAALEWRTIEKYVVLSVLPSVPPEGFFRPGTAPGPKTIRGTEADVGYGVLRSLSTLPGAMDRATAEIEIPETLPLFGLSNAERYRRLINKMDNNYSGSYVSDVSNALAFLHSDASDADKRVVYLRAIQHGIDIAQAHLDSGYINLGGAGQHYGQAAYPYLAAFGLGDPALLGIAQTMRGGAFGQMFWVDGDDVGAPVNWPATGEPNDPFEATWLTSDIGIPQWDRDPVNGNYRHAAPTSRYLDHVQQGALEALNVYLLTGGPGGVTGAEAVLQGPMDPGNPNAVPLATHDRYMAMPDGALNNVRLNATDRARWSALRGSFSPAPWTGRPDWVAEDGQATTGAADGVIDCNWSALDWATEPITRRDLRYSLDGLQYFEVQDVGATHSLTGLTPGLTHRIGARTVSGSGAGRWSPNWPSNATGASTGLRNTVAAGGTASGTPVNTTAPRLLVREIETWPGSDMVDAGTSYSTAQRDSDVVLYAGVGYWSGAATAFTYQWQADGTDLAGETSASLSLKNRFGLSGADIACVITTGGVSATTQTVTLPTISAPADFAADFTAGDASAGWTPHLGTTLAYDAGNGRLEVTLGASAFAGVTSPAITTVAGDQYLITAAAQDIDAGGDRDMIVGTTPGGDDLGEFADDGNGDFSQTVTAPGDQIYVTIRRRGGSSGNRIGVLSLSTTRQGAVTPTHLFSADFAAGDDSGLFTAFNGASMAYDAANGELDVTCGGSFGGIVHGPITVAENTSYTVTGDMRNESTSNTRRVQFRVGTAVDNASILDDPRPDWFRGDDEVNANTFTTGAGVTQIYLHVIMRGNGGGQQFAVRSITLDPT